MTIQPTKRCIARIPGCSKCDTEVYRDNRDHECDDLCKVTRDGRLESESFHALTHAPIECEFCHTILDDKQGNNALVVTDCKSKCCIVWECPSCKAEYSSAGPIDCPTCESASFWERLRFRFMMWYFGALNTVIRKFKRKETK